MTNISAGNVAIGAPFGIGSVLNKTVAVFTQQIGKFLLLAFIPLIPVLLLVLLTSVGIIGGSTGFGMTSIIFAAITGILTFGLQMIAQATSLYGAFQEMRSQSFTIEQSLQVGLTRAVPVVGVALLGGLAAGLAAMLLVVPGLIVACMLYVAIPACVIEKSGVMESLSRSVALTKGYRWQIFGLVVIVAVAGIVVALGLGLFGHGAVFQLLEFIWKVVATAFGAVLVAVTYHDLRLAKEGIDTETLANVFD